MAHGTAGGSLMSRPKSPDGHRHHVNIKLSDAERDAIDAVRGDLERGPWMRQAALSVAYGYSGIPQPERGQPHATGITAQAAPKPKNCKHQNLRMAKGVCPDCKTYVTKK